MGDSCCVWCCRLSCCTAHEWTTQHGNVYGIVVFAPVIVVCVLHEFQSTFLTWLSASWCLGWYRCLGAARDAYVGICRCRVWKGACRISLRVGRGASQPALRYQSKATLPPGRWFAPDQHRASHLLILALGTGEVYASSQALAQCSIRAGRQLLCLTSGWTLASPCHD